MFGTIAAWWPVLSPPSHYREEAEVYRRILLEVGERPARTVLELGSGGGHNASHLKQHFDLTLVDRSPRMLHASQQLNPECEHLEGDMRSLRLDRQFDAVFVHDAIAYITSRDDLAAVFETAFVHCKPGGGALFVPDHVKETFSAYTSHGGSDADGRGLRYLEWTYDPDPNDTLVNADFVYLLREADGTVHHLLDRHVCGLFPRADWEGALRTAGFRPHALCFDPSATETGVLFPVRKDSSRS